MSAPHPVLASHPHHYSSAQQKVGTKLDHRTILTAKKMWFQASVKSDWLQISTE
jgi:hypothetical protein